MYGKHTYSYGNSVFSRPRTLDFNLLVFYSSKNVKRGRKLELTYLYACWIMHNRNNCNMKIELQRWPEIPLILGRSGTQYVTMVTKLLSWYCEAHLVESYCKESNISDSNSLIFFSYLIKFLVESIT